MHPGTIFEAGDNHMQGLPEMLLPYLRLAHCTDSESLKQASLDTCCSAPISAENELTVLHQLASHLQSCLSRWASGLSAPLGIRLSSFSKAVDQLRQATALPTLQAPARHASRSCLT